ncbi:MAG TPA: hypothetical protein VN521_10225 [Negativicutes bacterium]|nr:hypothetical protein [Negativicutes bacterium]
MKLPIPGKRVLIAGVAILAAVLWALPAFPPRAEAAEPTVEVTFVPQNLAMIMIKPDLKPLREIKTIELAVFGDGQKVATETVTLGQFTGPRTLTATSTAAKYHATVTFIYTSGKKQEFRLDFIHDDVTIDIRAASEGLSCAVTRQEDLKYNIVLTFQAEDKFFNHYFHGGDVAATADRIEIVCREGTFGSIIQTIVLNAKNRQQTFKHRDAPSTLYWEARLYVHSTGPEKTRLYKSYSERSGPTATSWKKTFTFYAQPTPITISLPEMK